MTEFQEGPAKFYILLPDWAVELNQALQFPKESSTSSLKFSEKSPKNHCMYQI